MKDTQKRVTAVAFGLLLTLTSLGSPVFASNGPSAPAGSKEVVAKSDPKPAAVEADKAGEDQPAAGQLAELSEGEMQQVTGKHIVVRRGDWYVYFPSPKLCTIFGCITIHRHPK